MRIVFCDDDPFILRQLLSLVKDFFANLGGAEPEYTVYPSGDKLIRHRHKPHPSDCETVWFYQLAWTDSGKPESAWLHPDNPDRQSQ